MKKVTNIILVIFCYVFTNLSFVYADIESEKLSIVESSYNWIKINKRIPTGEDFNSDPSLPGRYADIVKKFDNGTAGEFKEILLDLDVLNGGKFVKIILQSTLSQKYWLHNPTKREKLQNIFIEFILFPWILENQRWPNTEDYGTEEGKIGFIYTRVLNKDIGFFTNFKEYIEKIIVLDKKETFLKYIIKTASIGTIIQEDSYIKEKVQRCFITQYLVPWILKNQRWPQEEDYGTEEDKIGIVFSRVINGFFTTIKELKNDTLAIVDDDTREILASLKKTPQLNNNDIEISDEQKQIIDMVFDWTQKNSKIPNDKDYGIGIDKVGITIKNIREVFRNNMATTIVRNQIIERLLDSNDKRLIDIALHSGLSQQDWFKNPLRREKLKTVFIKFVLLPWMDENKRFLRNADFLERSETYIGFYRPFVFTSVIAKTTRIGLFDDRTELIKKIILITLNIDTEDFFNLELEESLKILEEAILKGKDKYLRIFLQSTTLDDGEKSFFITGNTEEGKQLLNIAQQYALIKSIYYMEKYKKFPSDFNNDLGIPKTSCFSNDIELITFIEKLIDIRPEKKNLYIYVLEYLSSQRRFYTKERILRIINLDTEKKYLKHILVNAILPNDMYNDEFILQTFQEVAIRDFFFTYMDEYHEYPPFLLPNLNEESSSSISHNPNFKLSYSKVQQLFSEDVTIEPGETLHIKKTNILLKIIELDKEEKYAKYILASNLGEKIYLDTTLKLKLQQLYIKHFLIPWIKANGRFPTSEDFKPQKDTQDILENNTPYLFSYPKIISQRYSSKTGLFDSIAHLRTSYELVKELIGFDDSFIYQNNGKNNNDTQEKTRVDSKPLCCEDLFTIIYVYPYK